MDWSFVQLLPPAELAVSLAMAKAHLNVDHTFHDGLIAGYLQAAIGLLDGKKGSLQRCLAPQVWEMSCDRFPRTTPYIEVALPPLIEIVSITYDTDDDVATLIAPEDYWVDSAREPGRVKHKSGLWPAAKDAPNSVRVIFKAGYEQSQDSFATGGALPIPLSESSGSEGSEASAGEIVPSGASPSEGLVGVALPAPIRAAILIMVADMYAFRESFVPGRLTTLSQEATIQVQNLLLPYTPIVFA